MTSREQVAVLHSLNDRRAGLRVEFVRRGDRYGHRVAAVAANGAALPLMESTEGEPLDAWPASPALQALNADQLRKEGGPAALIGMSGSSHWSLSVEASSQADGVGLVFDAACRAKSFPPRVSSQYRLAPGVALIAEESGSAVRLGAGDTSWRLRTLRVGGQDAADASLSIENDACTVTCRVDDSAGAPMTVRWRYCVELI